MKTIITIAAAFFALLLYAGKAVAQKGDVKFDVNYSYSMPLGNFKNNVRIIKIERKARIIVL